MPKKILGYLVLLWVMVLFQTREGQAFSIVRKSTDVSTPVPKDATPDYLKGAYFVKMTPREFSVATGKNLNIFQRIYFKAIQHRIRKQLQDHPNLLITQYYDPVHEKFKFNLLWFVIGSFIGPLGVLTAYSSRSRKGGPTRKSKLFSVWLGLLFFIVWFGYIFIF
ncbi:MAG: hypothetical protein KGM98_04550 [Bacteroidota bacterium]|nr:hypothetical protein [Bacteroidota bacterium]